jgi:hypothetical protein
MLVALGLSKKAVAQSADTGRGRYDFDPLFQPNSLLISPGVDNDIITQYNRLASSEFDGIMGTLSATNRRVLILTPGTYNITQLQGWELNTQYVDVTSITPEDPEAVIVTSSLVETTMNRTQTVEQTATDVNMSGFTIENTQTTGSGHGLYITEANTNSIYRNMRFNHSLGASAAAAAAPLAIKSAINDAGDYVDCESTEGGWVALSGTHTASLTRCKTAGGIGCYQGAATVIFDGTMQSCVMEGLTDDAIHTGANAEIYNSRLTQVTTGVDLLSLVASGLSVYNSDLLVLQGGAGIPIVNVDANAKTLATSHCRMNNASIDADGIGANLTDNIGTPNNVIDDDIV